MDKNIYDFAFIAGSGALAHEIIINARENNINLYVIALNGISDANVIELSNNIVGIGEIGKIIKIVKENNIKKLAIAGYVKRPDFSKIAFDAVGLKILAKILLSAKKDDDAITVSYTHLDVYKRQERCALLRHHLFLLTIKFSAIF